MDRPVLHIDEADIARDWADVMRHVQAGTEIVIDRGAAPVAVLHAPLPVRRRISECLALLSPDSPATIDADFARDVDAVIGSHREPLKPLAWD